MIQFYAPDINETQILPETESQHCAKVLRMKSGDMIQVVDGKGYVYNCTIINAHHRHTYVCINSRKKQDSHFKQKIEIAIAPTKNTDRMEWFVEKATEIGITQIDLIKCEHSERKELKAERLNKIAISAMKQSLKSYLPTINKMDSIQTVMAKQFVGQKFICYCDENIERKELINEYIPGNDALILIGPEGDFSKNEIELALESGFMPVTLGNTRLRTETAAMFAISAIHTLNMKENK